MSTYGERLFLSASTGMIAAWDKQTFNPIHKGMLVYFCVFVSVVVVVVVVVVGRAVSLCTSVLCVCVCFRFCTGLTKA